MSCMMSAFCCCFGVDVYIPFRRETCYSFLCAPSLAMVLSKNYRVIHYYEMPRCCEVHSSVSPFLPSSIDFCDLLSACQASSGQCRKSSTACTMSCKKHLMLTPIHGPSGCKTVVFE